MIRFSFFLLVFKFAYTHSGAITFDKQQETILFPVNDETSELVNYNQFWQQQGETAYDGELTENDIPEPIPRITGPSFVETFDENPAVRVENRRNTTRTIQKLGHTLSSLWYQPVVVLLNDNKQSHRVAESLMNAFLEMPYVRTDFWLAKFNSTGVSEILGRTSGNTPLFINLLKWSQINENSNTYTTLGFEPIERSVVFYSIIKVSRVLPPNSGILLFTNGQIEDEDLAQLAMKEMFNKGIKLLVVWTGFYPTLRNEEQKLKQAAILSGGGFFWGNMDDPIPFKDIYLRPPEAEKVNAIILLRTNLTGHQQLQFPINTDVTSIHISFSPSPISSKLISPAGFVVNVLNQTQVQQFSMGSFSVSDTNFDRHEIHLNTARSFRAPASGIWRLDVDGVAGYNVTVSVHTDLGFTAYLVKDLDNKGNAQFSGAKKVLRLDMMGDIKNIENITLVNHRGVPFRNAVPFTIPDDYDAKKQHMYDAESVVQQKKELNIEAEMLPQEGFFIQVTGKDSNDRSFSRLSYFDQDNANFVLPGITIAVGAESQLLVTPNQQGKIFFEVTNNRDQVTYLYFACRDEKSLLVEMQPRASWLNPKQTVIVTVTTQANNAAGVGYRNLITFTASGPDKATKAAAMYVNNQKITDNEDPSMWHRYTSDCTNVLIGKCEDATWSIEVTAQDRESGLLQLTSNPKTLYFPNDYIAGTKERIVGYATGSCCQSKIQLTAVDLSSNRRTYTADAYVAPLNAGSIAAIVLGIIIFIIIIVVIVVICRKKCRSKESVDLPSYRGAHGRSARTP